MTKVTTSRDVVTFFLLCVFRIKPTTGNRLATVNYLSYICNTLVMNTYTIYINRKAVMLVTAETHWHAIAIARHRYGDQPITARPHGRPSYSSPRRATW